jgi:hypothetical protein
MTNLNGASRPRLHPELDRAVAALERASGSRLPHLREALSYLPENRVPAASRDLYLVARSHDTANGQIAQARRMGGVLLRGGI